MGMRVAVLGHSGLIGTSLCIALELYGHEVVRLSSRNISDPQWKESLLLCDAVINLAGESIGNGIWTQAKKQRILKSREDLALIIAQVTQDSHSKISVWINASAVGYYGDGGTLALDESSSSGQGFLAEVCKRWESPVLNAKGLRTVCMRFGVVLSPRGGMLAQLIPIFRLGMGTMFGKGNLWMSWIHLEDAVSAILHVLNHPVSGPVNVVTPQPVLQSDFYDWLAKSFKKTVRLKIPAPWVRMLFRDQSELFLLSQRVVPRKLLESGFRYHFDALSGLRL